MPVSYNINITYDCYPYYPIIEPDSSQDADLESSKRNMICASKFNEAETRTSQIAIAVALPIVAVGVVLASGLIILGVVFFIYCHHRKEKLKLKEETDHTDMESDTDAWPPCKSHYHAANHDLSNSQTAVSFRRTVSDKILYSYISNKNLISSFTAF